MSAYARMSNNRARLFHGSLKNYFWRKKLKKFAFIARHTPTSEQIALAEEKGIELTPVGDMDAFTIETEDLATLGDFDGVVVVHPAAAMRLCHVYEIGVFENSNRAPVGEKPDFFATELHVFDLLRDLNPFSVENKNKYKEGFDAFKTKRMEAGDNPYPDRSLNNSWWYEGWKDAADQ